MPAPSTLTSGPTSSPPRWAASSEDRKIKVGVRVRFVVERVVPPLARVGAEATRLHDRAEVLAVPGFDGREALRPVVGDRVHQVVAAAHRRELTAVQMEERQIHAAAAAVARPRSGVTLLDHLGSFDVRVVPELGPAVLRLPGPAHEAVDG